MSTMTEEVTDIVKPDYPVGTPVRVTVDGQTTDTTVTYVYPGDDWGVGVADRVAGLDTTVVSNIAVRTRRATVERIGDPPVAEVDTSTAPDLQTWCRVADARDLSREGTVQYPDREYRNGDVVNTGRWYVSWDAGRNSTLPEARLVPLPWEQQRRLVRPGATVDPSDPFPVGARVRAPSYGDGTVLFTPTSPDHPHARAGRRASNYGVKLDNMSSGGAFGNGVFSVSAEEMALLDSSGQVIVPEIEGIVNPLPLGDRVIYGRGMGTIVDKATVIDVYQRQHARSRFTSPDYVGILLDGEGHEPTLVNTSQCLTLPDLSHVSDADRLRALQVMIHRVASYEAVQRSWCDEVNSALASLGDLLPEDLRQVDRNLGHRLNKRNLFSVPGITPMPDPVPVHLRFSLTYEAVGGFTVTVETEADTRVQTEIGESVSTAHAAAALTPDMLRQVIQSHDGEWPALNAGAEPAGVVLGWDQVIQPPATA